MTRVAAAFALALAGCAPCRRGTLFLEMTFPGDLAAADQIDVVRSLDDGPEHHQLVMRRPSSSSDSVEVEVPDYREGARLQVRVVALVKGARVGRASQTFTLAPACTAGRLALADLGCPPPSASGPTWVDAENGTDGAGYGGGEAECANRTIGYALRNDGVIHLAPAAYGAGESFPLVLHAAQSLECHGATIAGFGVEPFSGLDVTVELSGDANQLHQCAIVGGSANRSRCVWVAATIGTGFRIDGCDISRCSTGAEEGYAVEVSANSYMVTVSNNLLHDSWGGVFWVGPGHPGNAMTGNRFEAIRAADVVCDESHGSAGVTGAGNQHSDGGTPCEGCAGCPF